MKNITIIAKTKEKDSYQIDNCIFFFEFALAEIENGEERDNIVKSYGVREIWGYSNPCVSIRRRVDNINGEISYREWDIVDFGNGFIDTAKKFGDTEFYSAISLDPIHTQIINRANKINELTRELNSLNDRITPHKFMRQSPLDKEYEDKFTSELKSKKLYSKAQKGEVNPNVLNAIKKPIMEEYNQEKNRIFARIDEIKQELKELE